MRILFLDIDGVLATNRAHLVLGKPGGVWTEWDPICVGMLKMLCDDHQLRIVITSTWRKSRQSGLNYAMKTNDLQRYQYREEIYTKVFRDGPDHLIRGKEIRDYLERHPEITDYIVFDDETNGLYKAQLKNLIKTHTQDGISFQNYRDAKDMMAGWS